MVVFGQSGSIRVKVFVFGQKWLYSGIVVVLVQKWLYSGKRGFFREKWLYSGKKVVFGKKVTYFMYNETLMTMVQWKSSCDYCFLIYWHFYSRNPPSKMALKKCFLLQQLECR